MRQAAPLLGITLAIALLTVGIALLPVPEAQTLASVDGAVTLTGVARRSQPLALSVVPGAFAMPLLGRAYEVTPEHLVLDRPFMLTFSLRDLGVAAEEVSVFLYRDDLGFWTPVDDALLAREDELLTVTTTATGRYALAVKHVVEAPVFLTLYDELRALAPIEAFGSTIDVGYRVDSGPVTLLPHLSQTLGCGGVFVAGPSTSASELTRNAEVLVDDVLTDVTFVFHATWNFGAGEGCAEGAALEPLIGS